MTKKELDAYSIVFPKKEQYQGLMFITSLSDSKMNIIRSCTFKKLPCILKNLKIYRNADYYITANTFKSNSSRRVNNLFALNNIVFDIDIHNPDKKYDDLDPIENLIWRMKRDLFEIESPFRIPYPNLIVRTGRGIQIWWHIESASAKLLFLYNSVVIRLKDIFMAFIKEYPSEFSEATLDCSASGNAAGLYRAFGSWNTHTKKKVKLEIIHKQPINLNNFNSMLKGCQSLNDSIKKKKQVTISSNSAYIPLHRKRLSFIEYYVAGLRTVVGKRDNILFLYYNAAIQIMSKDSAKELCRKLNSTFDIPLEKIDYIFTEDFPLKFTENRFLEMLGADNRQWTDFEEQYAPQSHTSRDIARQNHIAETKSKKELALSMLLDGNTVKCVSETLGIPVSTLYRISYDERHRDGIRLTTK